MHNRDTAPMDSLRRLSSGFMPPAAAPRRVNHGSSAWSLPSRSNPAAKQPQDGSDRAPRIAAMPTRTNGGKLACEPEDAGLTGGTRSLSRRVLGLNVTTGIRKEPLARILAPLPAQVA